MRAADACSAGPRCSTRTASRCPRARSARSACRGPLLSGGYWNMPEETAETFRDGWMHTGDVAREDEDGFWYIVDRTKDMIVTGGFNVFPREVEDVVAEHPSVAQVCVIGTPDEKWGEAVTAIVVLRPDAPSDDEAVAKVTAEIQAAVKERKGSVQSPKQVDRRRLGAGHRAGQAGQEGRARTVLGGRGPRGRLTCLRERARSREKVDVSPADTHARQNGPVTSGDIQQTVDAVWRMEAAKIVATLTRTVGDVGLAEDLAADALVDALDAVAGHRRAAQRGRLADHRRQAQGDRPLAPPRQPRREVRDAGPRAGNPHRRARVGPRPHRRRRAAADLHLVAPGAVTRRPDRLDAARGRRSDHRGDRAGVPVVDADDRGADHQGEEDAGGGRRAVRSARPVGVSAAAVGGADR